MATHCNFGVKVCLDGVGHATHNLCHEQSIGTVIKDCTVAAGERRKTPLNFSGDTLNYHWLNPLMMLDYEIQLRTAADAHMCCSFGLGLSRIWPSTMLPA